MTTYKAYVLEGAPAAWKPLDVGSALVDPPVTPPGGGTGGGGTGGGGTPPPTYTPPTVANMTLILDEQWATIDPTRWKVYDNNNFGAPQRVQLYKAANAAAGTGTAGATNGTSLRLTSKREAATFGGTNYNFTAGMLDTRSVGVTWPLYGRYEFRCRTPHGQGLWPSIWLTCDVPHGGATTAELDILEYFHGQLPGSNSTTFHGTDNSGAFHKNWYTNNGGATGWPFRTFFEHPTYTPGWHLWTQDIIPVTDATGATKADLTAPSNYVKFSTYLDGVKVFEFVNTSSTHWTTAGGTADQFWNIFVQGCQIGGPYVGYVDDPLGYDTQTNACMISGTPPNACTTTRNGTDFVQRAQFDGVGNVLEVDFLRVYKLTS